jgi:hypothetical protein
MSVLLEADQEAQDGTNSQDGQPLRVEAFRAAVHLDDFVKSSRAKDGSGDELLHLRRTLRHSGVKLAHGEQLLCGVALQARQPA